MKIAENEKYLVVNTEKEELYPIYIFDKEYNSVQKYEEYYLQNLSEILYDGYLKPIVDFCKSKGII